ncbi:MAG: TonB family protein [Brevundimonas sp.]|uniref:TonB family protein n=1 Tax=Brevundimonas sp. TaxID=1871086 RepID=UPI0017F07A2A|nr:TonB family protein [Brevundimonas sp.]MBA4805504.1 TonB family protein [Brevundimonas sp.]
MMIRTAGGPGLVSPIDFHERREPRLSRNAWIAIGVVAGAHLAVGAALYYQRFELEAPPQKVEGPVIQVTTWTPPRLEPKPAQAEPKAANAPVHRPETPPRAVETAPVVFNDAATESAPVVSLATVVDKPVEDAPPARTPEPEPRPAAVIRNPSWARQPTGEQLMRAYPDRALARGVGGSATLNCLVLANGSVSACDVVRETPAGMGFGRAAQGLSRHFGINPRTVDGAAQGSRVIIDLRFVPPAD